MFEKLFMATLFNLIFDSNLLRGSILGHKTLAAKVGENVALAILEQRHKEMQTFLGNAIERKTLNILRLTNKRSYGTLSFIHIYLDRLGMADNDERIACIEGIETKEHFVCDWEILVLKKWTEGS